VSDKSVLKEIKTFENKIPDFVKKWLFGINRHYNVVIAGGYCRDLIYNKYHKDIDIFIEIGATTKGSVVNFIEDGVFDIFDLQDEDFIETRSIDKHLDLGYNVDLPFIFMTSLTCNKEKIQLIFIDGSFTNAIKGFDFSFNQVWYSLDNGLQASRNFIKTFRNKEVFLVREEPLSFSQLENKLIRIKKFKTKFPEMSFLDEEKLTKLHNDYMGKHVKRFFTTNVYSR